MRNTRSNATSTKYWENETPIVTETEDGAIHYYKEAGKIQLYSTYVDKDGEVQRGKGCVWDNNEMDPDNAVRLVYGIMQGLLDCGVENDAFADAYNLLDDYVNGNFAESDDFPDEEQEENNSFVGSKLIYEDGEVRTVNKKVKGAYLEWGEDASEWVTYIDEQRDEITAMPTKTQKQKTAQNEVYASVESELDEWIESWGDAKLSKQIKSIMRPLLFGKASTDETLIKLLVIIDKMVL